MEKLNPLIGKELKSLRIEENSLIIELISSEIFVVKCVDFAVSEDNQPRLKPIKVEKLTQEYPENLQDSQGCIRLFHPNGSKIQPYVFIRTELCTFYIGWIPFHVLSKGMEPSLWQKCKDGTLFKIE